MKKKNILFLLIINFFIFDVVADSVIKEIYFSGLQRISVDTILSSLPIKNGSVLSQDSISSCIKILFSTEYFEEIRIFNNHGIITINVKERPLINIINLYKNKVIKSDIVQQVLNSKNIKSGHYLNNCTILEVTQELEKICYDLGKINAKVSIVVVPIPCNQVNLKVVFTEGKFTKVNQINIFGNQVFSHTQLLNQLTLYNNIRYNNLVFYKKYQNQKLLNDLEALKSFYLNHGYAKFCIDKMQVNFSSDKKNVCFDIYITEGHQYSFQSVTICGNILDFIPAIRKLINIKPGELYSDKKVKEIEQNIRNLLGKRGYIQPDILIESDFNSANRSIRLYFYVNVGTCFYVREIRFEGNDITKDSIIRREIQHMEQIPLNCFTVLTDQTQLKRFSYFKTVNTYVKYVPNVSNELDLIYSVEERNTGNLNLSFGFGTESGFNTQISINQENLLGTGNALSIAATRNRYQTYFDASMLQKYVGSRKMNISSRLFYNNSVPNKVGILNYDIKNYGANIYYSYPFTINKSYKIGLNYISNHLNKIAPQIAIWRYLYSIGMDPVTMNDGNNLNSNINFVANDIILVTGWTFNDLNHMYFPESGIRLSVTSNLTLFRSDNKYYKLIVDGNHYLSIDKYSKWVLVNSIYAGYSGSLFKHKESPFYDNFYIGGIETVRGFQLNSIGPKAVYYKCNDYDTSYDTCTIKKSSDAVGGNAIVLVKTELILPILSYINKPEYFDLARISLFIDSGTVWDTFWKNTAITRAAEIEDYSIFNCIRISSGISLKWMSPIGPVMFSYSKLIKKYPGDIEEPFQFSIGKSW